MLLLIPASANNYTKPLKDFYRRFFLPCDGLLVNAVEKVYHDLELQADHPSWLFDRIDVPDSPPTSETVPSKHKPATSSDSENVDIAASTVPDTDNPIYGEDVEGEDEEYSVSRYPEATRAAIRARMKVNQLETVELKSNLFRPIDCHILRLDLRNHIVRMWYRDTRRRLLLRTALEDVPSCYHEVAVRVFTLLECAGVINFGIVPFLTPFTIRPSFREKRKKRVAIIGAGISGLIAARQLRSFGLAVTAFEAKNRAGGRIFTETTKFSAPVDLGAMIITGTVDNPLTVLADQTYSKIHNIGQTCPLFDIDGSWVPSHVDDWAQKEYNAVLDAADRYRKKPTSSAECLSLGVAFQRILMKRVKKREGHVRRIQEKLQSSSTQESIGVTGQSHSYKEDCFESGEGNSAPEGKAVKPYKKRKRACTPNRVPEQARYSDSKRGERNVLGTRRRSDRLKPKIAPIEQQKEGKHSPIAESSDEKGGGASSKLQPKDDHLIGRLLRWHIANLEYACAAPVETVSLQNWDQDDPYAFQGDHVFLKDGFAPLVTGLMKGLERNVRFNTEVVAVRCPKRQDHVAVESKCTGDENDEIVTCEQFDAVLITVPLGVLKDNSIIFDPPLPSFKQEAIDRLGTGGLMKVAMEFKSQFWHESDTFGALRQSVERRGAFYLFWNMKNCVGKPILIGMVAEPVVSSLADVADEKIVLEAMGVLRRRYPDAPDPMAHSVTRWSEDRFIRGAYTHIPVGSSGADYDDLAKPVEPFIFFGGEHTCRTNPTTCASGLISGLREAHRIADNFGLIEEMYKVNAAVLKGCFPSGEPGKDQEIAVLEDDVYEKNYLVRDERKRRSGGGNVT